MNEAFVQLRCPECLKAWEATAGDLSAPDADFRCPDCDEQRRLSEFCRTERDLETLTELS
jgi:tRNA(Ile2) C34 agmatinyltransferase TiaS